MDNQTWLTLLIIALGLSIAAWVTQRRKSKTEAAAHQDGAVIGQDGSITYTVDGVTIVRTVAKAPMQMGPFSQTVLRARHSATIRGAHLRIQRIRVCNDPGFLRIPAAAPFVKFVKGHRGSLAYLTSTDDERFVAQLTTALMPSLRISGTIELEPSDEGWRLSIEIDGSASSIHRLKQVRKLNAACAEAVRATVAAGLQAEA